MRLMIATIANLRLLKASILSVVVLVLSLTSNSFAGEVGVAKRVKNVVTASQGSRKLSKNDAVFSDEKISAENNSHGELLLSDNTKIIVGENSSVSLDSFAVSSGGIQKGTLSVAKGALRLITGNKAKKGAYTVKTPNATIGARGTGFDTYYNEDGSTDVVLIQGTVQICSSGSCFTARSNCDVINVARTGQISRKPDLRSGQLSRAQEDIDYDLLEKQSKYGPRWRLPIIGCIAKRNLKVNERIRKLRGTKSGDPKRKERDEPDEPDEPDDTGSCTECLGGYN